MNETESKPEASTPPVPNVIESARRVLAMERDGLMEIAERLGEEMCRAVEIVLDCRRGKVIVTGMGKSGLVGAKIASTLASTGTPSFFVHPAEGLHGDLGMIGREDVVIALSNSGSTGEVTRVMPAIKRMGCPVIVITGKPDSELGEMGDVVLDVGVSREACPHNLAPTTSTTAALAMGDALAIAVLEQRGFRPEDFHALHPGGSLGRRLMKVGELMQTKIPTCDVDDPVSRAIGAMSDRELGNLGVVGVFAGDALLGVITDGDLRRAVGRGIAFGHARARDLMTADPKTVHVDSLAEIAVQVMESKSITSLFVHAGEPMRPVGIVHLHHLLRAGVV